MMHELLFYYFIGGLTTVIMSHFVLFVPILEKIAILTMEHKENHKAHVFMRNKIIAWLVFSIAIFLLFPMILIPLFSEDFRRGFIDSFVEGATSD